MEETSLNLHYTNQTEYNIVFDIDGVLAVNRSGGEKQALFFARRGEIIHAVATHYIFPGIKEFFQRLAQEPQVRISFFSSGAKERNESFCPKLLKSVFGPEKAKTMKINVYSRGDLVCGKRPDFHKYKLMGGNKQKSLKEFYSEKQFPNTVLIDDNCSYIASGEEKNLIFVGETESYSFWKRMDRQESWTPEGDYSIPFWLFKDPLTEEEIKEQKGDCKEIQKGKYLTIYPSQESGYSLCFKNKGLPEITIVSINDESEPELCKALSELDTGEYGSKCYPSGNALELVHKYLEGNGGETKIKRVLREANYVYYVAGILFTALARAKAGGRSLSEELFDIQFKVKGNGIYEPKFKNIKKDKWYRTGLAELQKVNPNLRFNNPATYVAASTLPASEAEQELIQRALDEESNGCTIM